MTSPRWDSDAVHNKACVMVLERGLSTTAQICLLEKTLPS